LHQTPSYQQILTKLFDRPSIVIIGGTWKTGKTDFGLKMSEDCLALDLVSEVASNIDTQGHYPQLSDLVSTKQWLYQNSKRKLYIFDEASEHLPNTRTMCGKSVGIKSLIPQISKAHGRMIVIGHNISKVDKEVYDKTWCRGLIMKPCIPYKYTPAIIYSDFFPRPLRINQISPTKIKFDPYTLAPFTERPEKQVYFKEETKNKLWTWSNGATCKTMGVTTMQINRLVRDYVRKSLELEYTV
jgi:hypothetical protein